MNIEYVARHYDLTDRVREYAEGKLKKVMKFVDEPIEIRVSLERAQHHQQRHIAELHIAHRHGVLQAADEAMEMFDAINSAVDKLETQARRSRKKFLGKRRRADRAAHSDSLWPVDVLEGASLGGGSTPRIIKSSQLRIKPMSVEEAALELRESKNDFIVFRSATTDRINVLYRRKDSNFGLITPDFV